MLARVRGDRVPSSTTVHLANQLTIARLFLTAGFVAAMTVSIPFARTVALGLFVLASITDYLDGWVARRFDQMSDFGRLMDPLVDKIMTAAAFVCLCGGGFIPAWAVVVVVAREFAITGLRLLAASKGSVLSAERLGKHKTFWQIATILYFLGLLAAREWSQALFEEAWTDGLAAGLLAVTLAFTVYSGAGYLFKHRDLLRG